MTIHQGAICCYCVLCCWYQAAMASVLHTLVVEHTTSRTSAGTCTGCTRGSAAARSQPIWGQRGQQVIRAHALAHCRGSNEVVARREWVGGQQEAEGGQPGIANLHFRRRHGVLRWNPKHLHLQAQRAVRCPQRDECIGTGCVARLLAYVGGGTGHDLQTKAWRCDQRHAVAHVKADATPTSTTSLTRRRPRTRRCETSRQHI